MEESYLLAKQVKKVCVVRHYRVIQGPNRTLRVRTLRSLEGRVREGSKGSGDDELLESKGPGDL